MTQKIKAYCPEIMTIIRNIHEQNELLKDFKEKDQLAQEFIKEIKEQQENLKSHLEETAESKTILDKLEALNTDLKLAVKGAAQGSQFKPAELKGYFVARAKESGVEKVVTKAETFQELESVLM